MPALPCVRLQAAGEEQPVAEYAGVNVPMTADALAKGLNRQRVPPSVLGAGVITMSATPASTAAQSPSRSGSATPACRPPPPKPHDFRGSTGSSGVDRRCRGCCKALFGCVPRPQGVSSFQPQTKRKRDSYDVRSDPRYDRSVRVRSPVGLLHLKWLFTKDTEIENRRRGAAKLAAKLQAIGLRKLPEFLIDYSVGDYSGMANKIHAAVRPVPRRR